MAIPISYNIRNVLQRPVSTITTAIGVGLTVTIFIGALALAERIPRRAASRPARATTRSCSARAPTARSRAGSRASR